MNTIENIKIDKTYKKTVKDESGNKVYEETTKKVKREINLVKPGVRFGYFLIDLIFIYVFSFIVGIIMGFMGFYSVLGDDLWIRVIGVLCQVMYYFIFEATTGTTFGKMILGYVVINKYAESPKAMAVLGRSFSRLVPFEALSCFGERGWHDQWSNTYVVKKSEKEELQKLLGTSNYQTELLDNI